jgi:hypothetical protein
MSCIFLKYVLNCEHHFSFFIFWSGLTVTRLQRGFPAYPRQITFCNIPFQVFMVLNSQGGTNIWTTYCLWFHGRRHSTGQSYVANQSSGWEVWTITWGQAGTIMLTSETIPGKEERRQTKSPYASMEATLKMETICSCEVLVQTTTWCHKKDGHNTNISQ